MSVKQEVIDKNLLKLTYEADADKVEEGLAYSFNKNKKIDPDFLKSSKNIALRNIYS